MDSRIQKVFSYFLYVFMFLIFAFSVALVWPVYKKHAFMCAHVADLNETLERRTAECIALNREVHDLEHKPAAAEKVAREKYNLCREGEIILKYEK